MSAYSDSLKDPRWQKKRLEVFHKDNFTCFFCGDKETTLNVHHFKYNGKPWEANDGDLVTICDDCHWFEHNKNTLSKTELAMAEMISNCNNPSSIFYTDKNAALHKAVIKSMIKLFKK